MCDHCGCREFGPTAELTIEHDELLRLAWEVAEANRLGELPDPVVLRDLADLHRRHASKEETGLFPLLLESGGCPPEQTEKLAAEHVEQTRLIESGDFGRTDYYSLAAHIEEEETELFPMAMFGFDDKMWADMESAHRAADETP